MKEQTLPPTIENFQGTLLCASNLVGTSLPSQMSYDNIHSSYKYHAENKQKMESLQYIFQIPTSAPQ